MVYNVWGDYLRVVDILEDNWITIPLKPGWESRLLKLKIYLLGLKDCAIVNEIF
jgi:hypothetical protein